MRDDRYKRAPTPLCWRRFMRRLYREADRLHPERLTARFTEALSIDLRQQLGPAVLADLAGDKGALPGMGLPIGRAPTALLADIDARISALPAGASGDPQARRAEAQLAISEYVERWGRELNTHLSSERAPDARAIMGAYVEAVRAGCSAALPSILSVAKAIQVDDSVTLEENLLPTLRSAS